MPAGEGVANLQGTVNSQLAELREAVAAATTPPARTASSTRCCCRSAPRIYFPARRRRHRGHADERVLFRRSGVMASVEDARSALTQDLPQGFSKTARGAQTAGRRPVAGGHTSYANPTLAVAARRVPADARGSTSIPPSTPSRSALAAVSNFVRNEFLPQLKALALCQSGILCRNPRDDAYLCRWPSGRVCRSRFFARGADHPEFDRQCFSATGDSFDPISSTPPASRCCAAQRRRITAPTCRARAGSATPMTAILRMTYPQGLPSSRSRPTSMTRPGASVAV